ncbi:MAG: aspartate kinase [Clostridia bacterium]|nr:aspartate kinase [Clostridia bacterium]
MRILVQKFGGTSVATPERREAVVGHIRQAYDEGYALVVVVSAMGRAGEPYATDTLQNLIAGTEVPAREKDLLLCCGEIISTVVLVGVLRKHGFDAVALTGWQAGIITDDNYGDARILRVDPGRVLHHLNQGQIVVVSGFQGRTEQGEITTLGRGGSDTTAAALGVALGAEVVEIYTDVDGIYTADPGIVAEAQTLPNLTYYEVCQLAYEGAKVIHPRAVEIAMEGNVPLRIKSTFKQGPGTLVGIRPRDNGVPIRRDRIITGITHMADLTQLKVNLKNDGADGLKVFKRLAQAGISVDFINVFPDQLVFTVSNQLGAKAEKLIEELNLEVQVRPDCAKVAAVGAAMRGVPGVMAAIVEALTEEKIEILQSVDSYTSIWCLVPRKDMERAAQALHRKFGLGA